MKFLTCTYLSTFIFLSHLFVSANTTAETRRTLGHFPLCEASAALALPCPSKAGNCLIVGDNEQRNDLFLFYLNNNLDLNSSSDKSKHKTLHLHLNAKNTLSDIEAMVPLRNDRILVFGSHSRNTKCEAKKNRRRFAEMKLSGNNTKVVRQIQSRKLKCDRLFGKIPSKDKTLKAACKAIDNAEKSAEKIEKKLAKQRLTEEQAIARCNEVTPFNAEGAVKVSTTKGNKVWIGLRAPLLAKHPTQRKRKNLAMLLRMKNLQKYKFDKVAFLDLDGRGVRELTIADDTIWLIAGPAADKREPFQLRSFPKNALNDDDIIEPKLVKTLPTSSEGLAIKGKQAYIVIDGDLGEDASAQSCKTPSSFLKVSLP